MHFVSRSHVQTQFHGQFQFPEPHITFQATLATLQAWHASLLHCIMPILIPMLYHLRLNVTPLGQTKNEMGRYERERDD